MSERTTGNPTAEYMNNFYMHMPKGFYRGADCYDPNSMPAVGMASMIERFGKYLTEPQETWPEQHAHAIGQLKTGIAVQKAIDEFLTDNPELKEQVEERVQTKRGSWNREDDVLIRPIYVYLREAFTEDDLTT